MAPAPGSRGASGVAARIVLLCACVLAAHLTLVGPEDGAYRYAIPKRLHATSATATTLVLRWAAPRGARAYRVQFSASSSMSGARYLRTTTSTGRLTGLQPGRRYWFRVRVVNPRSGAAMSGYTRRMFPSARTTAAPVAASPISWPTATPTPGTSTGTADVRVASFNLSGVNNDATASGDRRPWRERRPAVVRQILGEQADVVGLQEANQSTIYAANLDYGSTQYDDLAGAVNAQGRHYALTNENSYNCEKATSSTNCVPVYRGASNSTRILYNTETLAMLAQGSVRYATQTTGKVDRYLAWAVFRVRATGGELLFTDTHLDSYDQTVRVAQWNELISRVQQLQNGRPVVAVGDFNSTKFSAWAEDLLPRMQQAGFGDVLNQQFANPNAVSPRARTRVNAWVNSFNDFTRPVKGYADSPTTKIGNDIDWVFASNALVVKEWKTVIDLDPSTMQITGVIPSDHNLVRATIVIP